MDAGGHASHTWVERGWAAFAWRVVQVGMKLNGKRVIASIGDGSFQVTAQDLSTMIREGELLHARHVHDLTFLRPVVLEVIGPLNCGQ